MGIDLVCDPSQCRGGIQGSNDFLYGDTSIGAESAGFHAVLLIKGWEVG